MAEGRTDGRAMDDHMDGLLLNPLVQHGGVMFQTSISPTAEADFRTVFQGFSKDNKPFPNFY